MPDSLVVPVPRLWPDPWSVISNFLSHYYLCDRKHLLAPIKVPGFPGGSEVKVSACNAGDPDSIPGLRRSPGEGNGNPLQCSCLENPMERGAW